MIIDAFTHLASPAFLEKFGGALGDIGIHAPYATIKGLYDLDARLRVMDELGVDRQVVTVPGPPLEAAAPDPARATALARLFNDGIAEIAAKYPRFIPVGAVALTDIDAALRETERCIDELGLKGMLVYSNVRRRALDSPEYFPFFALMERYGLPIWLHPARGNDYADYVDEQESKYSIAAIFGWSYDTTLAMTRLVMSGYFEQLPKLKIIVHHAGAMVPLLAPRIARSYGPGPHIYRVAATGEMRTLARPPLDYYRMFYTDTVSHGSLAAVGAAYGFFGAKQIMFGTDAPFDFEEGRAFTRDHRAVIDTMLMCPEDRALIYSGNIRRLLNLD